MFNKPRKVSEICQGFTSELEAAKAAEEAKAEKLRIEIEERCATLADSVAEAEAATKAIDNIRKLFGS